MFLEKINLCLDLLAVTGCRFGYVVNPHLKKEDLREIKRDKSQK